MDFFPLRLVLFDVWALCTGHIKVEHPLPKKKMMRGTFAILMGLICRGSSQEAYRGIRKGGGTRVVCLEDSTTYTQIVDEGLKTFFSGTLIITDPFCLA